MSVIHQMNSLGDLGIPFLFVFDFELEKIQVVVLEDAAKEGLFFDIQGNTNYDYTKYINEIGIIHWETKPLSFEGYTTKFDIIQQGLHRGDSFLANLTCSTPIETNLSLEQIFYFSQAKYKLHFKDEFVCFSPETFVAINASGIIASYPMKGTIDASIPNAKQLIMNDLKEKAEHNTIVDLIRNDLSKVAKKVTVTKFRYLDLLETNQKNLYQASSEIQGQLPENWKSKIGDILMRLLPAGSISGAPKNSTIDIIRTAEQEKRGYYTGVFGVFDGTTLNSGVMIRFIEKNGTDLCFKSGGGITVFSDLSAEYQELINKIYVPIPRNDTNQKWKSATRPLASTAH